MMLRLLAVSNKPGLRLLCFLIAIARPLVASDQPGLVRPAIVRNSIGMALVKIASGDFLMGGQERPEELCAAFPEIERKPDYFDNEYPQHRVRISRVFLVGQYEVTVGQFRQFVSASGYVTQAESD